MERRTRRGEQERGEGEHKEPDIEGDGEGGAQPAFVRGNKPVQRSKLRVRNCEQRNKECQLVENDRGTGLGRVDKARATNH